MPRADNTPAASGMKMSETSSAWATRQANWPPAPPNATSV